MWNTMLFLESLNFFSLYKDKGKYAFQMLWGPVDKGSVLWHNGVN